MSLLIDYVAEKQHQHLQARTEGTGLTDLVKFYAAQFHEARATAARQRDQRKLKRTE